MSASQSSRDRSEGFKVEPRNKFFEVSRSIIDHEMRPGRMVTLLSQVDLTQVEQIRNQPSPSRKPSYTTFVVKAVALALREHPYANRRVCRKGFWPFGGARLQSFRRRDIAVAIERDVPGAEGTASLDVLRDADDAFLDTINADLFALSKGTVAKDDHWRESSGLITRFPTWISSLLIRRSLASPKKWVKYRGGAALVNSPSKHGVDVIQGTWSHPIGVSFGLVKDRPVVMEREIVARPTFNLSLNYDRSVMTGAQAARFFNRIIEILERAEVEMKPYLLEEAPPTREDFPTVNEPSTKL